MIQFVALVAGIAGQVYPQPAEGIVVHRGQDHRFSFGSLLSARAAL